MVGTVDGSAWLENKLAEIGKALRRGRNGRNEETKALMYALSIAYSIVRFTRAKSAKVKRNSLRKKLRQFYKDKGFRKPREGDNRLSPLVRLCLPKKTASDRSRYVGILQYWYLKNMKVARVQKRIEMGMEDAVNVLAEKGHRLWRKRGCPNIGVSVDWSK